ncbi:MAG: hypothetical protein KDB88_09865, partial [Flavobacteriales bacterium]|nr:hypothetical protein [Flavobacteriales bacterium]
MLSGIASFAQSGSQAVEQAYQRAEALYREDLTAALELLDSLSGSAEADRDQRARILFLKAITEARQDSIMAMRASIEQLFRNDRGYVMKPYDPLIVELSVKEEIYGTYEGLVGGRDFGPGLLEKDHGRWRFGLQGGAIVPLLDVTTDRTLHGPDGSYTYEAPIGWEALAVMDYEVAHNLVVFAFGGLSRTTYRAANASVRYEEDVTFIPASLGLRKQFWLGPLNPWVPYILAGGSHAWVNTAEAVIERSGDGVRLLGPKTAERSAERERSQWRVFGGVGLSRKVGHTVLFL